MVTTTLAKTPVHIAGRLRVHPGLGRAIGAQRGSLVGPVLWAQRLRHRAGVWQWDYSPRGQVVWNTGLGAGSSRLAAVFEAAVDAMVISDQRGMVQHTNPAVERLYGWSPTWSSRSTTTRSTA